MTKQATNYLLGQLEDLGYIERRLKKVVRGVLYFLVVAVCSRSTYIVQPCWGLKRSGLRR
jgi:hypothetical protein